MKWLRRTALEAQPLLRRSFAEIPPLARRRQENYNFEATFCYIIRSREFLITGNPIQK